MKFQYSAACCICRSSLLVLISLSVARGATNLYSLHGVLDDGRVYDGSIKLSISEMSIENADIRLWGSQRVAFKKAAGFHIDSGIATVQIESEERQLLEIHFATRDVKDATLNDAAAVVGGSLITGNTTVFISSGSISLATAASGNEIKIREIVDASAGTFFINLRYSLTQVGESVKSWSMLGANPVEQNFVTPVLWDFDGVNSFRIRGIGLPRKLKAGIQSYPFELVRGDASIGPNTYLGWYDGTPDAKNVGSIPFDTGGGPYSTLFCSPCDEKKLEIGTTLSLKEGYVPAADNAQEWGWQDARRGQRIYSLQFSTTAEPLTRPAFVGTSVTNAASNQPTAISPTELVTIYGDRLGPERLATAEVINGKLPTNIQGVRVLFNRMPAPLVYASRYQIAAAVPASATAETATNLIVEYLGAESVLVQAPTSSKSPALFSADGTGKGNAAATNQDGTVSNSDRPAIGGEIIVLYGTGFGRTETSLPDGQIVSPPNLPKVSAVVRAYIDGKESDVVYAGAAPGLVLGIMQINVRIPPSTSAGERPIVVMVDGAVSQGGVSIQIKQK